MKQKEKKIFCILLHFMMHKPQSIKEIPLVNGKLFTDEMNMRY
jgi:hypothetical protein